MKYILTIRSLAAAKGLEDEVINTYSMKPIVQPLPGFIKILIPGKDLYFAAHQIVSVSIAKVEENEEESVVTRYEKEKPN